MISRILSCFLLASTLHASDSYLIESVAFPDDLPPEIGAIEFDSNGDLYLAARRGDILIATPTEKPEDFEWRHFASGFHNPCGIHILEPGHIIISQMAELTEVIDTDNDGIADEYNALSIDFGLSGNYHETMDICPDGKGGLYLAPGTASHNGPTFATPRGNYSPAGRLGRNYSAAQWRGWVLHWSPEKGITLVSSGYRMHNGIERGPDGSIWVGDNQGDWRASSPIYHVTNDSFSGHPSSLVWDTRFAGIDNPLYLPRTLLDDLWNKPAFQISRDMMNSCAEPTFDTTEGNFGPFTGQMFVPDQSGNRIVRCMPQWVDGAYQGATTPFIEGGDLNRGNNRTAFSPEGDTLYVGQTGRGWGQISEGLQRIRFTGTTPLDVLTCELTLDGFNLTLTQSVETPGDISIERFRYEYGYTYGGDEMEVTALTPAEIDHNGDTIRVSLSREDLLPNYLYRIAIKDAKNSDGDTYSGNLVYTLNRLLRPESDHSVTIKESGDDSYQINIDDKPFTEYHHEGFSNPILYPILNQSGTAMTRDWPIREDGREGESEDHPHHKSLFIGHMSVNGIDFWHEDKENSGTIEHARTIETRSGEDRALLRTFNLWKDPNGKTILSDTREMKFGLSDGSRYIDLELNLHASHGEVTFFENKDGGVGLRTHPDIRLTASEKNGVTEVFGHAENSEGNTGESIWGKNANWVHYWGEIDGESSGIAILSHPETLRHPTWWHARPYGLIAPNPFGPTKDGGGGDLVLPKGQSITLHYRFLFHDKDHESADISAQYASYISEPLVPRTLTTPIPDPSEVDPSVTSIGKDVIPRGDVISGGSRMIGGKETKAPKLRPHGFTEGAKVFADRDFRFAEIPEHLQGGDLLATYNNDKQAKAPANYTVDVTSPGTLIVLVDTRVEDQLEWLTAKSSQPVFKPTKDKVKTDSGFQFRAYSAEVDPGTYVLGPQQGGSFYSVVAINRD